MGLCIIMLKHEVIAVDEWHRNEPQDLTTVSLCIQIAIDKMQLCSFSVAYACPYHNPTAHPHDTIHAVCHLPVQLKPGFIREGYTSPACQ
jgi:hypothetical protein